MKRQKVVELLYGLRGDPDKQELDYALGEAGILVEDQYLRAWRVEVFLILIVLVGCGIRLLLHHFLLEILFLLSDQLLLNGSMKQVFEGGDVGVPLVHREGSADHLNKALIVLDHYLSHLDIRDV